MLRTAPARSPFWRALALSRTQSHAATAYITNEKGNSISVIDLDKLEVTHTVKTGQRPRGIALSKDDALMFVALGDDDTIAVIDTKTLKEVGELPSGPDPEQLRVSRDGKFVFVANENDALLDRYRHRDAQSGQRISSWCRT